MNLALWLIIAAYGVIISWVLLAWRVLRARPRRLGQDELDEKAHQVSGVISARLDEEPDLAPPGRHRRRQPRERSSSGYGGSPRTVPLHEVTETCWRTRGLLLRW